MEMNKNEWNVSNLVWEYMKGIEWNYFMIILLLDIYFKIKCWIYRGILGALVKKLLNLISFPLIPSNFGEKWKFEVLRK